MLPTRSPFANTSSNVRKGEKNKSDKNVRAPWNDERYTKRLNPHAAARRALRNDQFFVQPPDMDDISDRRGFKSMFGMNTLRLFFLPLTVVCSDIKNFEYLT